MMTDPTIPCGVLVIDKPQGITSHDAVNRVRRLYGTRQVGHTGTLDPLATGVLPILVGRAAKAAEYLGADSKRYEAVLRLGVTTDTEDITGTVLTEFTGNYPPFHEIQAVCSAFVGESLQIPPMYSAIKIGGKKLVDLARKQIEIERPPRPIRIDSLDALPINEREIALRVSCSKGTYIRSLCRDIGEKLGCGGCMTALRRTRSGRFTIVDAITLDRLEQMSETERRQCLLPIEALFADLDLIALPPFYEKLARDGLEIYLRKIRITLPLGTIVRLADENGRFFAIGEVRAYPDGVAVKPVKQFNI